MTTVQAGLQTGHRAWSTCHGCWARTQTRRCGCGCALRAPGRGYGI